MHFEDNINTLANNTIVVQNVQDLNEGDYYCKGYQPHKGVGKELSKFIAKASLWIRGKFIL